MKSIYVLGINSGHHSTAALLKDGRIIGCVSEERFKRIKNYAGFPQESIDYLLSSAGITASRLSCVALGYKTPPPFVTMEKKGFEFIFVIHQIVFNIRRMWGALEEKLPFLRPMNECIYDRMVDIAGPIIIRREKKLIHRYLGVPLSNIMEVDHHTAHAYAAYYGSPFNNKKTLVFTLDGEGDKLCATVSIYDGPTDQRIAATHLGHSIGWIYMDTTQFLGMKPNEHEYKVMGLAPYAKAYGVENVYNKIRDIIDLDDMNPLVFKSRFDTHRTLSHFQRRLKSQRFDFVAGAVQKLAEDVVTRWIREGIRHTGIHRIALGGGVFMNVKLNMKIMQLPEVEDLFIFPSCGDESTPIGACFYAYKRLSADSHSEFKPETLNDIYLGPEFTGREIESVLQQKNISSAYHVKKCDDIELEIARLLSKNQIVARVNGRMEWGARALGNRSILANPLDYENLRVLNEWIKDRDFWMPFTPTILKERENDYIVNPKHLNSPYMLLTFPTTPLGRTHLKAAIHPYDFTARVQILEKELNPSYYKIIKEFERLTGAGGILNTSFNIHGEPMVCSPQDALATLEKSDLKYLALGNYLISKKEATPAYIIEGITMNVSIISPNLSGDVSIVDMGITYLATYLNERTPHRASILDFTYHKKDWRKHLAAHIKKYNPDIIGITCVSMYMHYVKNIISEIKNTYKLPIVLGGYHVTLMPEESVNIEGVDAICIGDGEFTLTDYLDAKENKRDFKGIKGIWAKKEGVIIKNEPRELIQDLDALPMPNYDLWEDIEKFIYYNSVLYFIGNRGCPFNCTYCSEFPMKNATTGKYLRRRNPREYAREIKTQWEKYKDRAPLKVAHTFDAVFPFDKKWVAEFCDEYKKIGLADRLPFSCFTRADTIDQERVTMMAQAGLKIARIGIEAGNDRIRKEIYEKDISTDQYRKIMRMLHDNGVAITGYNILGGPDETMETMWDTFNLVKELKIDRPIFFTYRPLPKTEGAKKVVEYGGTIDEKMWDKIDSLHEHSNVFTQKLTPGRIVWFRRWCLAYFMSRRAAALLHEQGLAFIFNFFAYVIHGIKDGVGLEYVIGYFFVSGGANCVH